MADNFVSYNSLLGVRGTGDSTQRGTVAGLSLFNNFLETKGIFSVSESLCDKNMLSEYGDYLINHAVSQTTGGSLKPGSILQYLSGVVNELGHRYGSNELFKGFKSKQVVYIIVYM